MRVCLCGLLKKLLIYTHINTHTDASVTFYLLFAMSPWFSKQISPNPHFKELAKFSWVANKKEESHAKYL